MWRYPTHGRETGDHAAARADDELACRRPVADRSGFDDADSPDQPDAEPATVAASVEDEGLGGAEPCRHPVVPAPATTDR